MKILICEDDVAMMKIIQFTLERENSMDVIMAEDGQEAMDFLQKDSFDLILTDIHMPFYSGLEIIEFVRKTIKSNVPILVLSVEGFEDKVLHAFKIGADDYIVKPFNPLELIVRVKKFLNI